MQHSRKEILRSLCGRRALGLVVQVSLLLIGSPNAGTSAESQNTALDGRVLCLKGDWYIYNDPMTRRPIKSFDENSSEKVVIHSNQVIRPNDLFQKTLSKPPQENFLVIVDRNNFPLVEAYCFIPNACSRTLSIPGKPVERGWFEEPVASSMHRMREIGAKLNEGVSLILSNGVVDLRGVMYGIEPGTYYLSKKNTAGPADSNTHSTQDKSAYPLKWDPEEVTTNSASN